MKKGCLFSLIGVLVLMTVALVYYFAGQNENTDIVYEYTKPTLEDIALKAVASGSVRPRKEVNIKPQVSGIVDELYVEAGDMVTKGQKLAKIKLIPSEVNINSARSNVELAQLQFQNAKREAERQRKVSNSRMDIEQAKANYDNSLKELKRQEVLFEQGVISEQELDQVKLDAELKKSVFENSEITANNQLQRIEVDFDIRKRELEAAQNNLQLLREGRTSNSKQVANVITSTMTGMVLDVPVEEGSSVIERNNFNEGTSVAIIADMGSILFEGKVDESDVGKLKEGMPLKIKVGAIDDEEFIGILEFISPKGEVEEGSVKFTVKAAIDQSKSESFLRAGYSANADIILQSADQVIAVQERDVIIKDEKSYVEIVTGDQTFEEKEITTGLSDGILIEVKSGLDTSTQIKLLSDPKKG